jgi:hypothetical protein
VDDTLRQAYKTLFRIDLMPEIEDWQIAEAILGNFNIRELGEHLAKSCIFRIVNHIAFPNQEITIRLVGKAEGLATELWDGLSDEPHMAELEWEEYKGYYKD